MTTLSFYIVIIVYHIKEGVIMYNQFEKDKIYIEFLKNMYLYNIVPLSIISKILQSYEIEYLQSIFNDLIIDKALDILDKELENIDFEE